MGIPTPTDSTQQLPLSFIGGALSPSLPQSIYYSPSPLSCAIKAELQTAGDKESGYSGEGLITSHPSMEAANSQQALEG